MLYQVWKNEKAGVGITGQVEVWHHRAGKLLHHEVKKNITVNTGLNYLRALVGNGGVDIAKWLTLSTNVSAPAAGDINLLATVHTANGLARVTSTYAAGGTGVYTLTKVFTCTSGPQTVASAGIHYQDAVDTLFAGVAITSATLQTNDTLTLTWTVTFTSV